VLGGAPGASFGAATIRLEPGAMLLVHSGGVTGASNAGGQRFGVEGLERAVKGSAGRTAADLVHAAARAVARFAGGRKAGADATLLALEYLGTEITYR
jgi:serine phosphatase RsbU (regulator of sigma subunit)